MPVKRIWHGWTTPANADAYQTLLREFVFPGIEAKNIPGFTSIEMLRRDLETEVEFITIMTFDALASVIAFQGEDYRRSYVPDEARRVLSHWDEFASHYEVMERRDY